MYVYIMPDPVVDESDGMRKKRAGDALAADADTMET
jgi:hypothetical protein